jgi:formyltetrahydrofolate deformylase
MSQRYTLVASCRDNVGIVAHVSTFIAEHNGWITEASYHTDTESNWFFMRHVIDAASLPFGIDEFREKFKDCASKYNMEWRISDSNQPKRILILASKEEHCLAELLYRWRSKDFNFEIVGVVSNHELLRDYVEFHKLPYHHIPVSRENQAEAYAQIEQLFQDYHADIMVLARYMQILPADFCQRHAHQVINIHHSFLPSFAGARPYHQAYERGVKLIGATSHYVTEELDAGPIIEQDVVRISHETNAEDMVRLGKDVEKLVLARALRYEVEDRVLIHNNKTVVFS